MSGCWRIVDPRRPRLFDLPLSYAFYQAASGLSSQRYLFAPRTPGCKDFISFPALPPGKSSLNSGMPEMASCLLRPTDKLM
jgi:hypothetical protein